MVQGSDRQTASELPDGDAIAAARERYTQSEDISRDARDSGTSEPDATDVKALAQLSRRDPDFLTRAGRGIRAEVHRPYGNNRSTATMPSSALPSVSDWEWQWV